MSANFKFATAKVVNYFGLSKRRAFFLVNFFRKAVNLFRIGGNFFRKES